MRKLIYVIIVTLLAPLVSAKEKGNIQILCEAKVKVFLNGVFKGKSREKLNGYLLKNLDYGTYNIELEYQESKEDFTIELNDTLQTYISKYFTRPEDEKELEKTDPLISLAPDDLILVDVFPELLHSGEIQIPEDNIRDSIAGIVWIKAFIDEKGEPAKVQIQQSSGNLILDSLAIIAGRQNRYLPAISENKPIGCWITYRTSYPKDYLPPQVVQSDEDTPKEHLPEDDEFVPVEVMPELIKMGKPDYPNLAKAAGIEGIVWIKALVDKDGDVVKAQIAKSSGTRSIDESAVKAAYKNKFTPGIQNGKPVAVWITYKVNFELNN